MDKSDLDKLKDRGIITPEEHSTLSAHMKTGALDNLQADHAPDLSSAPGAPAFDPSDPNAMAAYNTQNSLTDSQKLDQTDPLSPKPVSVPGKGSYADKPQRPIGPEAPGVYQNTQTPQPPSNAPVTVTVGTPTPQPKATPATNGGPPQPGSAPGGTALADPLRGASLNERGFIAKQEQVGQDQLKALDAMKDAKQQEAQANIDANQAQADANMALAKQGLAETAKIDAQWKDAQQRQAQRNAEAADRARAISNQHIDPNRFFTKNGTAGAIVTGIGSLLVGFVGGMGAGAQHSTDNKGLDAINGAIQSDIDAQRADIQNAKDSDARLNELSNHMYGEDLDMHTFMEKRKLDLLNYAKQQTDALVLQAKSPIIAAQAKQAAAAIDGQIADANQEQAKSQFATVQTVDNRNRADDARKAAAAAGAANKKHEELRADEKEARAQYFALIDKGVKAEDAKLYVDSAWGGKVDMSKVTAVPTKGTTAKPNEMVQSAQNVAGDLKSTEYSASSVASHIPDVLGGKVVQGALQWTDSAKDVRNQQRYNTAITSFFHKSAGIKNPEDQTKKAEPFLIKPGDPPERIKEKVDAFQKEFGNATELPEPVNTGDQD